MLPNLTGLVCFNLGRKRIAVLKVRQGGKNGISALAEHLWPSFRKEKGVKSEGKKGRTDKNRMLCAVAQPCEREKQALLSRTRGKKKGGGWLAGAAANLRLSFAEGRGGEKGGKKRGGRKSHGERTRVGEGLTLVGTRRKRKRRGGGKKRKDASFAK